MRIAINARFLIEGKMEGIGYSSWEIYRRFVELNPQHTFIFFFDRPYSDIFTSYKNVIPVRLFPPARHPFLWFLWFEMAVPVALKKWKADVFFSHDGFGSLRSKIPVFITIHDLAFLSYPQYIPFLVNQFYRYFTPRYLKKAAHIFTVSQFVKEDIYQKYQVEKSRITVIPNGNRETKFSEIKVTDALPYSEIPYFFYYGAIHPRKNLVNAIQAFNLFRNNQKVRIRFVIAGRLAWNISEILTEREKSPYKEDIHFTGYLSDEWIGRYLKNSIALIYISLHEGFGLPIIEAFAAEVPVITSNIGAMAEIAGKGAYLVDPHRLEDIAKGMKELYENRELRKSLISSAKMELTRFNWDQSAHLLSKIITLF